MRDDVAAEIKLKWSELTWNVAAATNSKKAAAREKKNVNLLAVKNFQFHIGEGGWV